MAASRRGYRAWPALASPAAACGAPAPARHRCRIQRQEGPWRRRCRGGRRWTAGVSRRRRCRRGGASRRRRRRRRPPVLGPRAGAGPAAPGPACRDRGCRSEVRGALGCTQGGRQARAVRGAAVCACLAAPHCGRSLQVLQVPAASAITEILSLLRITAGLPHARPSPAAGSLCKRLICACLRRTSQAKSTKARFWGRLAAKRHGGRRPPPRRPAGRGAAG